MRIQVTLLKAVCTTALTLVAAGAALGETPQDLIKEYTEDINTERQLLLRGLGSESSLAIAYEYRGETYYLYLDEPKKAIADLTEAVKLFDRAATRRGVNGPRKRMIDGRIARSLLFRSLAAKKHGDERAAEKDISQAIEKFKKTVAGGEETLEPPLAWAYQLRAEMTSKNGGRNPQSIKDVDAALAILRKWGPRQKSLADKIPALEALRKDLASR